jgi:hypothetical protein
VLLVEGSDQRRSLWSKALTGAAPQVWTAYLKHCHETLLTELIDIGKAEGSGNERANRVAKIGYKITFVSRVWKLQPAEVKKASELPFVCHACYYVKFLRSCHITSLFVEYTDLQQRSQITFSRSVERDDRYTFPFLFKRGGARGLGFP